MMPSAQLLPSRHQTLCNHKVQGSYMHSRTAPDNSRRCRPSILRVQNALSAPSSTSASTAQKPPRIERKLHVDRMFLVVHEEMVARNLRVAHAKNFLVDTYNFRTPEDVWAILSKDDILFAKSSRMTASREWLGNGVFTQLNADKHAAARTTLNPAFRRDYLARLDSFMIASAQQLTDILTAAAAAAAGNDAGGTASGTAAGSAGSSTYVKPVDMQRLFRLLTLDTIGLTSLNRSFDALKLWQQQQQQHAGAHTSSSSSSSSDGQLELEQLLWDLESAFLWQSLQLPVPRSWLPGWSKYITACGKLDDVINSILAETRAQQQQQQQLQQAVFSPGSAPFDGHSSTPKDSSSSGRQTLVSFLLAAQQQQGPDQILDQQIRDEIKTVMFGGTDTSAFTLAVCAHYLAHHPAAAERAAAEVQDLLQQTGRSDVSQLRADDASKLPWVLACLNETMRLAPAGPAITRTATQDVELAGYLIPKGQTVMANLYAMHRHPEVWPQPDTWLPQRWIPTEAAAEGLTTRTIPGSSSSKAQPFLPFSTGPRGCIGRNYGLLQMVLTLAVLLGSGVRFQPVGDKGQQQLEFTKSMTMHVKGGVWLVPRMAA